MDEEIYISPERARRILNVSSRTLYNWEIEGQLVSTRTKGGHRRYLKKDILEKTNSISIPKERKNICYCRVSTSSQKEDLERQISFFKTAYPDHIIISDTGSGLNFKRKGFNSILESAIKGDIKQVVVTHKDRLCRFGFDLIENIISKHSNGNILVLNNRKTSPTEELVNDLISIITVFSSRLYGLRSNKLKKQIRSQIENTENSSFSNSGGERKTSFDDGTVEMVL